MSIFNRIQTNLIDIATFGPAFLWRHSPRITGAETAVISIGGQKIHVRAGESDIAAIRQVYSSGQYNIGNIKSVGERIAIRYLEIKQMGKIPVIIDAGANIGAASLWFAKHYPSALVVAVEPEPGNFLVLEKNRNIQIKAVNAAIGSVPGHVALQGNGLGWATQTVRADSGVPVITMEQAIGLIPNGIPFIAKIDIEGFESDLFSQNTEWLSQTFVVFIEPHDWMMPGKMTSRSFQRAMAQHDFELFITGEMLTYVRY